MSHSTKLTDVFYRFQRHGVRKYFAKIHRVLSKLNTLGAKKQDWEVFSTIFEHMSGQCVEFQNAVSDIRDQLSKDEDVVTVP